MQNNEELGNKIVTLRKNKGISQAELGSYLNVSYQAVSKWERGESYPDFDTLSRMAKFFNVPISYFEKETSVKDVGVIATTATKATGTKQMLGVCKVCGKVVYQGDEKESEGILRCKSCFAKEQEEEIKKKEEKLNRELQEKQATNTRLTRSFVVGGIVAALWFVVMIVCLANGNVQAVGSLIVGCLVLSVLTFTYIAQLFWDGWIVDCTLFGGRTFGTPGVIFEFSLDGFIFLIAMKLLFALLRLLFWLLTQILSIVVAMIVSPFTFFPALHRVRTEGI